MAVVETHEPATGAEPRTFTSVGKAFAILEVFEGPATTLGVSEVARRTNITKSTAFRLLALLEGWGYVERRDERYCLGTRLFELGNHVPLCRPRSLRDSALPLLCDLFNVSKRTVHLAVLDGSDVLYLEKLQGKEKPEAPTRVGGRNPARLTALGKAILAFSDPDVVERALEVEPARPTLHTILVPELFRSELDAVRRHGVAFDREEIRVGLTCVAAPILSRGSPIGAVSISGSACCFDPETMVQRVRSTAAAISLRLR